MFDTKDYILLAISVITSIIASVILAFSIHFIYLSIIFVLCVIIYIINSKLQTLRYIGVKRIEKNISNETDTEKLLSAVNSNFYMMGRGGSRFVEAQNFQNALSNADRRIPVRFLLLEPGSDAPEALSLERSVSKAHISNIVDATMNTLRQHKSAGYNIECRYYDNPKYIPIFRVVSIDDQEIFVSFYPRRQTGKNSFQIVLFDSKNNNNLYIAFKLHFESMWDVSRPVNI